MAFDLSQLFSLDGRIALVTGASRGIGNWIAGGLLSRGAKVYIVGRKPEACEAAARELGPGSAALPGDISSTEGRKAIFEQLSARESKLDILVNNAATNWTAPFETYPEHGWDKVMNVNVKSLFFMTTTL